MTIPSLIVCLPVDLREDYEQMAKGLKVTPDDLVIITLRTRVADWKRQREQRCER